MAKLSFSEKMLLEKAFGMSSGYVLQFSDRTFQEFVFDAVGRDMYGGSYDKYGTSKAKHLRAFWEAESDEVVAGLTRALFDHGLSIGAIQKGDFDDGLKVVERLSGGSADIDLEALKPNSAEPTFERLAVAVRESIDSGKPEEGLDRLHTFVVKYMRVLCTKHGIETPKDKPLHSLFGEYLKRLEAEGRVESNMTHRIMKSTISTLEAFNEVRNDQSLAHDNEMLHGHELYTYSSMFPA
jgi:hypothetical protein